MRATDASPARRRRRHGAVGIVSAIVREIEAQIARGVLKEGDRLPTERELALRYGVSRSTVRDAFYELELKSLVDRAPRRGTRVADLSSRVSTSEALLSGLSAHGREIAEVLDFRAAIEPAMAARAAKYATDSEIAELERLLEEMAASTTAMRDLELDEQFHALIATATHNQLFVQLVNDMSEWLRNARRRQLELSSEQRAAVIRGHADFVRAIRERDPEGAARVAADHVELVRRQMWPLLRRGERRRRR